MKRERRHKKKTHHVKRIVLSVLFIVVTGLLFLVYFSVRWCLKKWGNLTMEELIFTLKSPLEGTGQGMISEYIKVALLPAVVLTVIVLVLFLVAKKLKKEKMMKTVVCASLACALFLGGYQGVYRFSSKLNLMQYVYDQMHTSTFIKDNYVNPKTTDLAFPAKKRNVIYLFVESMEQTYMDTSVGGKHASNLIPELTKLAQENENFNDSTSSVNGAVALSGNTWTTGGMFAATAGLPLVKPENSNTFSTNGTDYYPQIKNFGDILKEQGYNQSLLIGSDAAFGNRDIYFSQHGNYDIDDYSYAKKVGWIKKNYHVFWGYEDEKLYTFAKKKLNTLSSSSKPFNLTMLTVDTHFPSGYKCRLCKNDFSTQYENTMACSSRQIVSFINWCKSQSWYKDTTIVISGDHPTMNAQICKGTSWPNRLVYTCYMNPAVKRVSTTKRHYTTQDNFPTTLAAMGVSIKGDRLGLGTNLFSSKQTLLEKYGYTTLNNNLKRKSEWMYEMMQPSKSESVASLQEKGKLPALSFNLSDYSPGDKTVTMTITQAKIPNKNQTISLNVSYRSDGAYAGTLKVKNPQVGDRYTIDVSDDSFGAGVRRNKPKYLKGSAYATYENKQYRVGFVYGKINYSAS